MKVSAIFASLALLGAVSAQGTCVEGQRVTISPGYVVEYRCGRFRTGTTHQNIASHNDCAAMCRDQNRSVCTYNASRRMCIVGDENGREGVSAGATYMVRVDDPESTDEDPFAQTCEEEKDELLERANALQRELDQCRAALATSTSGGGGPSPSPTTAPPTCGLATWGQRYYEVKRGMNLANCKEACLADSRCLSYSANSGTSGAINCYLYDKVTSEVPHQAYPNWVQYDKSCHTTGSSPSPSPSPSPTVAPPTCGLATWGQRYYEVKRGMNLENCRVTCLADSRCLSYSANSGTSGAINCYLYDKVTSEVPHQAYPNWVQYDKSCHTTSTSPSPSPSPTVAPPTCGLATWGQRYYEVKRGMTLANCKLACQADARCLSYSANSGTTGAINCYLYDKVTSEVPHQAYPNWVQYDKSCP